MQNQLSTVTGKSSTSMGMVSTALGKFSANSGKPSTTAGKPSTTAGRILQPFRQHWDNSVYFRQLRDNFYAHRFFRQIGVFFDNRGEDRQIGNFRQIGTFFVTCNFDKSASLFSTFPMVSFGKTAYSFRQVCMLVSTILQVTKHNYLIFKRKIILKKFGTYENNFYLCSTIP